MKKVKPTHHVLFDDSISGVCQGWRLAAVTKVGTKWTYFQLFEGTGHVYKAKNAKWASLTKHNTDKKGHRLVDHEIVIDEGEQKASNPLQVKKRRKIKKLEILESSDNLP